MPEARGLPLLRFGEELRRRRRARRASRLTTAATVATTLLAAAIAATLVWPPRPAFIWNASASTPVGLYRVAAPEQPRPGDMVVAWLPEPARRLAAERAYLPMNVPLVKRVAAVSGDTVCAVGEAVFVNGKLVARRRGEDPRGRPLPWWTGCTQLAEGELFLLMAGAADSFDGRYFGVTSRGLLVGRARLLWAS